MKQLIIYDCDGTLVDSEILYNRVTANLLNNLGLKEYTTEKCIKEFGGHSWFNIRQRLKEKHGDIIPDDLIARFLTMASEEMEKDLKTAKNARELLMTTQTQYKTCIASNGERTNVIKSLTLTDLIGFFDPDKQIFTKIQVQNPKPAPDLFLFAAEQMQTHPNDSFVIEDSPTGVRAGKAAGMKVIGYIGVAHDQKLAHEELSDLGADYICDELIHIPDVLKTL